VTEHKHPYKIGRSAVAEPSRVRHFDVRDVYSGHLASRCCLPSKLGNRSATSRQSVDQGTETHIAVLLIEYHVTDTGEVIHKFDRSEFDKYSSSARAKKPDMRLLEC
jgi:hypothetical protein